MNILHVDGSARGGVSGHDSRGSHSRRLSRRFVERWSAARPGDRVTYRDVGGRPPSPVTEAFIAAAFTRPEKRDDAARAALCESDSLTAEVVAADLIVVGAPMYNFGLPAPLKAWIDNIVRVGVTFGFDRSRAGQPYWPMLEPGKRLVILGARGDFAYGAGEERGWMNLVEAGLTVPFGYIGVTDSDSIAIEYDEFGGDRLAESIAAAEAQVDALVDRLLVRNEQAARAA